MKLLKDEHVCVRCDGAGLVPDLDCEFGVELCPRCNGHGVVLFVNGKASKYIPGSQTHEIQNYERNWKLEHLHR
jgi:DnaJ-class molecular chaperone